MGKNSSSSASNSSVCSKIRHAFSGDHGIMNHISSYHQEPKHATSGSSLTYPSSSSNTTPIQAKPHIPQQHVKANTEASGAIPIKFDFSTPTEKGNSAVPTTAHGQVANSQSATKVAAKGKPQQHVYTQHGHGHHGVNLEQQGKKSTDINDTFNEYIQRAKKKFRTMSNIDRGQNNTAQDHESHGGAASKKENHIDQFSDFIHRAKVKLRTTTIVRRTSSLRKGVGREHNNTTQDHEFHGGAASKKESHNDLFSDFIHRTKKNFRATTLVRKASSLRRG